jgi:predicted phosphoribosyltransferase
LPGSGGTEAGKRLAERLSRYAGLPEVLVLALPRGGVPVGFEVATALEAPLDLFLVRKLGLHQAVIDQVAESESARLAEMERLYRDGRPPPDLRGRTVILVDDGLATGSTMRAAAAALREEEPARRVVAAPVGAPETVLELSREVDEAVCVLTPEPLHSVGMWYQDFSQTTDDEVRFLLREAQEIHAHSSPRGRSYPPSWFLYVVSGWPDNRCVRTRWTAGWPALFLALSALSRPGLAAGRPDGSFETPFALSVPYPVGVAAGDFNHDGKLDLAVTNGSKSIQVLLQDPRTRLHFTAAPTLSAGTGSFYIRTVDLDGDQNDDLAVGDPGTTAYLFHSNGDGTFQPPVALVEAKGSRWITSGDWNGDGKLDLASANINGTISVFLGAGGGSFTFFEEHGGFPFNRPHSLEALDYDGDGKLDLMAGMGDFGVRPFRGRGDGRFDATTDITNLGCGHFIGAAEFNHDGKGDLITACDLVSSTFVGISAGDGSYRLTLEVNAGSHNQSFAAGDFNGDGFQDLAVVGSGRRKLFIYPSTGDGTFLDPLSFWPTGVGSVFLVARDLDGDGLLDVISADTDSSVLTLFWGEPGGSLLGSARSVSGFSGVKDLAIADLDGDGAPDLLFPDSNQPRLQVYLKPARTEPSAPSLTMDLGSKYTSLEARDLDGDGTPDLVGASANEGTGQAALLDPRGSVRRQVSLPAGIKPGTVAVGRIDGGATLDLAVPCAGSGIIAVFLGQGDGGFDAALNIPTIEKPKAVGLADLDGDGVTDLAVISFTTLAIQLGKGAAVFGEPIVLSREDTARSFAALAVADLDRDGFPDLLVADKSSSRLFLFYAKGRGEYEEPVSLKVGDGPISLVVADLDQNGFPDITTASSSLQTLSVILNAGSRVLEDRVDYQLGFAPLGHRAGDLDQDGALDLVAFTGTLGMVLPGRQAAAPAAPRFRRGDANGDGQVDLADPIVVLNRLFLGGQPLSCEDAADSNDDGEVNLTDPIRTLNRLFLGGEPLPPPGPEACGEDPTPDQLAACESGC